MMHPSSSLMDSTTSPKVKTTEDGVGECSPIRNSLGVEKRAGALRSGLRRLTSNSIIHIDLH